MTPKECKILRQRRQKTTRSGAQICMTSLDSTTTAAYINSYSPQNNTRQGEHPNTKKLGSQKREMRNTEALV